LRLPARTLQSIYHVPTCDLFRFGIAAGNAFGDIRMCKADRKPHDAGGVADVSSCRPSHGQDVFDVFARILCAAGGKRYAPFRRTKSLIATCGRNLDGQPG